MGVESTHTPATSSPPVTQISSTMRSKSSVADLVSQNPPSSSAQQTAHTGLNPVHGDEPRADDPPPVYDGRRES
jgi:hypothetical protein